MLVYATDGNSATIRTVLFDYRKAFDLIDHNYNCNYLRTSSFKIQN